MHIDLRDKVVIVTGAGRGIGRDIARTFAEEGAVPVLLDVNRTDLDASVEAIGGDVPMQVVDVRDGAAVQQAVDEVVAEFGRVDALVNNAGVGGNGLVEEMTEEGWDFCFDVNVKGVFNTCRAVVPTMKRQRGGRIINAASFAAIVPMIGSAAYAAAKSAVAQYSRALAGELGPWDITVNAYAPGMVPTALNGFTELPEEQQKELLDMLTLRRWGTAREVSELLVFLASDKSSYITGTMIDVSGGKLATQLPARAYASAGATGAGNE